MSSTARRRLIVGAELLVVAIVVVLLLSSAGGTQHRVYVTVPDATAAVSGQMIRASGVLAGSVGSITSVDGGHAARVELKIDDSAWPLPAGTTMTLKWGGTVSYANGYVDMQRGDGSGPSIPDGGDFPTRDFHVTTQFDSLLTTFDTPTRQSLRKVIDLGGVAFATARPSLARAIEQAPGALRQTTFVMNDLAENTATIDALVRATDSVVHAVQSANPDAADLITNTATTLTALAAQASNVQATLSEAPGALVTLRQTLAHADPTLKLASDVIGHLAGGVQQARLIARPLDTVLGTLRSVGPVAVTTLRTARRAAPDLSSLLGHLKTIAPLAQSVAGQAGPTIGCIRPYVPEIMALGSGWADFTSFADNHDPFIRMTPKVLVPAAENAQTSTPGQLVAANPGLKYSFPVPPGYTSGQPWYQPQCGITPDVLNAAKDPAGS
jgi:ABC-type transporter Mla subunit MlaD